MDDEEKFAEQIAHSYGQIEAALGAEGYKAMLENQKQMNEQAKIDAELTMTWVLLIRIMTLLILASSIPVQIFLWKWAVTY
jgi:hypothetical protein